MVVVVAALVAAGGHPLGADLPTTIIALLADSGEPVSPDTCLGLKLLFAIVTYGDFFEESNWMCHALVLKVICSCFVHILLYGLKRES